MSDMSQAPEDTPQDTPPEQEIDWRKRYEDLHPEYTRATQELSEWKKIQSDDGARTEWLKDLGYEIGDGSDPDDELDDEPAARPQPDPRVDHALNQLAEIQYERDLTKFLGDRELSDKGRSVVEALCRQGGNGPDALKQAVETWFEIAGEPEPPEEVPKSRKKAPHVLPSGKTATDTKAFSEMSRGEIARHMADQVRAGMAQT